MPLTFTPSSTGFSASHFQIGQPIQQAYGQNTTSGTKVFSAWNTFEEVPGQLRCSITPTANNYIILQAHLYWGGWNTTSLDVAANFRFFKSTNGGSTWTTAGTYATDAGLGAQATIGVGTGSYHYNWGDTNSSSLQDNMLVWDENITAGVEHIYCVQWACGYAPSSRTLYWNRSINTGNSYNPIHVCSITATEIKK